MELVDGQIHIEHNWVLSGPMTTPEIRFALPAFGK